ncbi:MAG: hypothetical protein MRY78_19895, partial [Saprospiraceae bacterium]|nr:hypothetical protein [Saprospiraceae bacterium]
FFILLFTLMACTTPQEYLQQQNYSKAFKLSLRQLQQQQQTTQNVKIMQTALDSILRKQEDRKKTLINTATTSSLKSALRINLDLQTDLAKAKPYLPVAYAEKLKALGQERPQLRAQLAALYRARAEDQFAQAKASQNKLLAQKAYRTFMHSKQYNRSQEGIDSLLAASLAYGQIIIVVETDNLFFGNNWDVDRQFERIENCSNKFRQVYYERNPSGQQPDCFVEINLPSVDFDTDEHTEDKTFKKEIIADYEYVTDTSGHTEKKPIYETIEGTVHQITKKKEAQIRVQIDVLANTSNCPLRDCYINESRISEVEIVEVSGNEDAIPNRYKHQTAFPDEVEDDDEMEEELLEAIYRQIIRRVF